MLKTSRINEPSVLFKSRSSLRIAHRI